MDFLGDIFRATAACASPRSNPIADILYGLIGFVSTDLRRGYESNLVLTLYTAIT